MLRPSISPFNFLFVLKCQFMSFCLTFLSLSSVPFWHIFFCFLFTNTSLLFLALSFVQLIFYLKTIFFTGFCSFCCFIFVSHDFIFQLLSCAWFFSFFSPPTGFFF